MLTENVSSDLKEAMKARDESRVSTLRMLVSALKNRRIDLMHDLTDEDELAVVRTLVKQYRDALTDFARGGRTDLEEKTKAEVVLLEKYLPAAPTTDAIRAAVAKAIATTGAISAKEFGKVMGVAMKELGGGATGDQVSVVVKELLSK